MKVFIITGTSQGIGDSLATMLLQEDHQLFCISRNVNERLIEKASENNTPMKYYSFDLTNVAAIEELFQQIYSEIEELPDLTGIYLINNAGVLAPVSPIEKADTYSIVANLHINLLAPMIMTSCFIKHTSHLTIDKRILNVSSGSAKYLLPSKSCYSTSKAGLDSFSKSIQLEQADKTHPVKIAAVYPGIIDTRLQKQIRTVSKEDFPYVDQFVQIAEQGHLQTPQYTARKLIDILLHDDFGNTAIIESI